VLENPVDISWAKERGLRLRAARKAKNLTQSQVGRQVGITQSHVSQLENGEIDRVSADIMYKIETLLDLPPGYFRPAAVTVVDERAASLERFLASPLAQGASSDEIDFLRGTLAQVSVLEGVGASHRIDESTWFLLLQFARDSKKRAAQRLAP
jgi:transcriptional regulator with XRE-family HTH domain